MVHSSTLTATQQKQSNPRFNLDCNSILDPTPHPHPYLHPHTHFHPHHYPHPHRRIKISTTESTRLKMHMARDTDMVAKLTTKTCGFSLNNAERPTAILAILTTFKAMDKAVGMARGTGRTNRVDTSDIMDMTDIIIRITRARGMSGQANRGTSGQADRSYHTLTLL